MLDGESTVHHLNKAKEFNNFFSTIRNVVSHSEIQPNDNHSNENLYDVNLNSFYLFPVTLDIFK